MPHYSITHTTRYKHNSFATAAWQALHLQPRNETAQHCDAFELHVAPHPIDLSSRFDYFGNKQHLFTLREPHRELTVTSHCVVRRDEPVLPMAGLTPACDEIPDLVDEAVVDDDFALDQFLHASPMVPLLPGACALAEELGGDVEPGTPVMDWLTIVGGRFSQAFTFDREATRISTPLAEVIEKRRGVCQDFAHVMIALLRPLRIPCRYVSGYLFHREENGNKDRSVEGASHAWVEAFVPRLGWIAFDPTNNLIGGDRHIRVAIGRDYADVPPTRGVHKGGAESVLSVAVTVNPSDAPPPEQVAPSIVIQSRPVFARMNLRMDQEQQQQ